MIFLIEYNRPEGCIVSMSTYDDSQRNLAWEERLEIELELFRKGVDHEVVLLEAESEEALRRTHRRYFESFREIAERGIERLTSDLALSDFDPAIKRP